MHADRDAAGGDRLAAAPHVPRAVEPGRRDVGTVSAPARSCRPGRARRGRSRGRGRRAGRARGRRRRSRRSPVVAAEQCPHPDAPPPPRSSRRRRRWSTGVCGRPALGARHVRQAAPQGREDEAAQRDDYQRQREERPAEPAADDRGRDTSPGRAHRRSCGDEDSLAPPAVQQHPGERPDDEYGSSTRRTRPSMAADVRHRSGLNSTAPARPARNTPSPNCPASRVVSSRRNSASASSSRRWGTRSTWPTLAPWPRPRSVACRRTWICWRCGSASSPCSRCG